MDPSTQIRLPIDIPLRRKTPSMPAISRYYGSSDNPMPPTRQSPDCATLPPPATDHDLKPRPLRITKLRHSPSTPLRQRPIPVFIPFKKPSTKHLRPLNPYPAPRPRGSSAAGLLTTSPTPGNDAMAALTKGMEALDTGPIEEDLDGSEAVRREAMKNRVPSGSGMAWLQKRVAKNFLLWNPFADTGNRVAAARKLSEDNASKNFYSKPLDISISQKNRCVTDPGVTGSNGDMVRRATTSGGYTRVKQKVEALARAVSISSHGSIASEEKKFPKPWNKRVFSKELFTGSGTNWTNKKREITKPPSINAKGPLSISSQTLQTNISTPDSISSCRPPSSSSTLKATNNKTSSVGTWQLDGTVSSSFMDNFRQGTAKPLNDSVVAIFNGTIGGLEKQGPRTAQWKLPMLSVDVHVAAEADRVPFSRKDDKEHEFWVAIELGGKVSCRDLRLLASLAPVGLDVGLLLDISAYTSPANLLEMKRQARRIIEAIDTSRDRIAVMTFSAQSIGRRKPSSHGRSNLKVLNYSGSVSKKKLLDDISSIQLGVGADPARRDVGAAVMAASKVLNDMPLDNMNCTKRNSHLFLLTSRLEPGEIQTVPAPLGGMKVHTIGIGPVFSPTSDMGGNGWCMSTCTFEPGLALKTVILDGISIPVEPPEPKNTAINIEEIILNLRAGMDLGTLEDINVLVVPADGYVIKAIMGEDNVKRLLPGERRSLLVRVGVINLQEIDSVSRSSRRTPTMRKWDVLEQQLKAELGELKSNVLTVAVSYRHAYFSDTTLCVKKTVEVLRYIEDSVWGLKEDSSPSSQACRGTDCDYVQKALIQKVASSHASPYNAWNAVEEVAVSPAVRGMDYFDVSRELSYRIKMAEMFQPINPKRAMPQFTEYRDYDIESNATESTRVLTSENDYQRTEDGLTSPSGLMRAKAISGTVPQLPQLEKQGVDWRPHTVHESHTNHYFNFASVLEKSHTPPFLPPQSPDEAKRLWRELKRGRGSYHRRVAKEDIEMDMDISEDGNEIKRKASIGEETLATLRDVKTTDCSPWIF